MTVPFQHLAATAALVLVCGLAGPAAADPTSEDWLDLGDPTVALEWVRNIGDAELDVSDRSWPMITGWYRNKGYVLEFFGCDHESTRPKCTALSFTAGFRREDLTADVDLEALNALHQEYHFGLFVEDGSGGLMLRHDFMVADGVSVGNAEAMLLEWTGTMDIAMETFVRIREI